MRIEITIQMNSDQAQAWLDVANAMKISKKRHRSGSSGMIVRSDQERIAEAMKTTLLAATKGPVMINAKREPVALDPDVAEWQKCHHEFPSYHSTHREALFKAPIGSYRICAKCGALEYECWSESRASGGTPRIVSPDKAKTFLNSIKEKQ